MGYRVYSFRDSRYGQKSEADEFFHAAEKARESIEKMHDLACEMEDLRRALLRYARWLLWPSRAGDVAGGHVWRTSPS